MSGPQAQCPTCSELISFRRVAFSLVPPRVDCPKCGTSLVGFKFVRLPPIPFLVGSLALGLVVGIAFGAVITLLSRDWPYSYRFILLGVALAAGALVVGLNRKVLFRDKSRS